MLRKLLKERGINLTKAEFGIVMEIVTDDIKFNRINFKKCTSLDCVLDIAIRSADIFKKCA
ncbi:hypothetical protein EXN54_19495 [Clostridium botulinum]|uniref:hypothetical protein n=1 Tax=Clostridium botulinum TaxID=1491 RepID=UPI0007741807|nr:hypothetical protein [Clostridium botulinum]MBN3403560.1 hypothetical protein [Clostridium botulinum]NEZ84043.1 hypothetical protein [Clostridium botulinum]NFA07298.1 hypothetical protein [Clostridium botulinum]NFA25939.1 hypothetical protein [Clostridium botulinum]NFB80825.1 hypothetical protein [Clostridium botulinum]